MLKCINSGVLFPRFLFVKDRMTKLIILKQFLYREHLGIQNEVLLNSITYHAHSEVRNLQ